MLKETIDEMFYNYYFDETAKRLKVPISKFTNLNAGSSKNPYYPKSINQKFISLVS